VYDNDVSVTEPVKKFHSQTAGLVAAVTSGSILSKRTKSQIILPDFRSVEIVTEPEPVKASPTKRGGFGRRSRPKEKLRGLASVDPRMTSDGNCSSDINEGPPAPVLKVGNAQKMPEITGCSPARESREIVVDLPEQPWTKPFSTVTLRAQNPKSDADGYQSSSGIPTSIIK